MDSSKNMAEDEFTLSSALATPCISLSKQEPHEDIFIEQLLANNDKAQEQTLPQIGRSDKQCFPKDENNDGSNEHQHLLNPLMGQCQQIATSLSPALLHPKFENTNVPSHSPSTGFCHDLTMGSTIPFREAPFLPISPTGCVVTIHNLPYDISMRDVLARVSGGEVRTATLLKVRNAMCAVITFKEARSAQLFVHASRSFNEEIWTFSGQRREAAFVKAHIAYAPALDTSRLFNDPASIPMEPRFSMAIDLATRCLAITNCSFELIQEIWGNLSLSEHLCFPHYTNQFEDIWLDGFQRGRTGRVESATLHIWYTNTNMALGAKHRLAGRSWSKSIQFEADPCDDTPAVLFFRPSDDAGFAWHSNPNHSLLNVFRAGCISELFQAWREITCIVDTARIAPPQSKRVPRVLPCENMATLCEAAQENGGFDPVTLLSMSSQDYDSDDEGGRAPPRIDTRKIHSQKANTRKEVLPSRTAYLTILEKLAASAPPTYDYSPGTCTAMSTIDLEPVDETEYPDCALGGFAKEMCSNSNTPPDVQRRDADEEKDPTWSDSKKTKKSSEENFAGMSEAFKEPTYWYTVSLAEFLACNEQQHRAMGTLFYVPPAGHSSFKKYSWKKELADDSG